MALPAAGRTAPAPSWPLTDASDREALLWEREWLRPQALMWECNGQELEVALYVRTLVEAEVIGASAALRVLVRQQQEALGLSLPGLHRNHWTIETETPKVERAAASSSSRSRLKVVQPNAG